MDARSIISIFLVNFLLNCCSCEETAPKVNIPAELFRLPRSVFPEYYKLNVFTHINDEEGFKFFGDVLIKVYSFVSLAVCSSCKFYVFFFDNQITQNNVLFIISTRI